MNKITKYVSTGVATLLMLMSIGAVQNNANAAKTHHHIHVTRNVKHVNHNVNRRSHKMNRRGRRNNNRNNSKRQRINKRNQRMFKNAVRRYHKHTRRNKRNTKRYTNRLKRRRHISKRVLKPRYRIVSGTRRGNRALRKSGFYDGQGLAKAGYSKDFANFVFSKYAPNDKRAVIPMYMNPKGRRFAKKYHITNYHNVNNYRWVQGNFSLTDPQKNTKNPRVYKYYPKLHGWKLAPRY